MAKDIICGMVVDEKQAKKKGLVSEKSRRMFYFCSKDCKKKFEEESGHDPIECGNCMKECNLKETIWKIKHKGKLYCFCSEKCKKKFEKEHFGEVIY